MGREKIQVLERQTKSKGGKETKEKGKEQKRLTEGGTRNARRKKKV